MTTIEAHRAAPGFAVYSGAKAAVEQFSRTLAVELAPSGIRVNNVAPDCTPTPNMTPYRQQRLVLDERRRARPRHTHGPATWASQWLRGGDGGVCRPLGILGRQHTCN
jgi:NAD(P)-dependent dehydrogenase (short-subunit alcohol dehydrogenase family)